MSRMEHNIKKLDADNIKLNKTLADANAYVQNLQNQIMPKHNREASLVHIKHMTPFKLEKIDEWRRWREEVLDYCDEVMTGMREALENVMKDD